MTCLVAWRGKHGTVVGTDSQWTAGVARGAMPTGKMWHNGRFIVAVAGSIRASQILQFGPQFNQDIPDEDLVNHLICKWVPSVIAQFNDAGGLLKDADKPAAIECEALIVSRKKIVRFGGDLSVVEERLHYAAGGGGEEVALGFLAASDPKDPDPVKVVRRALEATSKHCTGVSAPFYTEIIK